MPRKPNLHLNLDLDASTLARMRAAVVPAQVFVGGASVMALELLGSRLFAPRFGSTLYVWGSLIGVVMAALAAGAYLGGRWADRAPDGAGLSRALFLAGAAAVLLPMFSPWVIDAIADAGLGLVWGPLVATLVLLAPPVLLLGTATPFAIRLLAERVDRVGNTSGGVTALSTGGSIAGTFLTAFVLVPNFRLPALFALVGALLVAAGLAGMRERGRALVAVAGLLLVSPVGLNVAELTAAVNGLDPTDRVLHESETPYHHIRVVEDRGGLGGPPVRELHMDGLVHGAMYVDRPGATPTAYVKYFHLGAAFHPEPERVLFIGAGAFSGPKLFLNAYPNATIDVVELDPEVVEVAGKYFHAPLDHPRVNVHTMDGRRYLAQTPHDYDIIVLDAYSRTYIPFHLMTVEFFLELSDRLAPDGVVVSNIIAATSGDASGILKAEVKTMQQALPATYVFPVGGASGALAQNVIVVANRDAATLNATAVAHLARNATTNHTPDLAAYAAHLHTGLDTYGAPILRDDFAPVEILLNPVTRQPFERGE